MNRCKFALTVGGALAMGLAGVANADEALRSEVAQLKQQVAELQGQNNANWLNERRAEEVKALIGEVLADADTRASLMADGMTAGHNGTNFFVASADGGFMLTITGQIQFQYILDFNQEDADGEDEGFRTRRTKLGFGGHVTAGRKWDYEVVISLDRDDSNAFFEDIKFGTQLSEEMRVDGGKFKLPFLREELTSSKRLLAVDRSVVGEFFTLNRAEQVQLSFKSDMIKAAVSVSDGANSETSDIGGDGVEFSVTGRVDIKIQGDWKQAADFTAWSGEPMAIFLGAALHQQFGDGNNAALDENYFSWTIDGSVEMNGLGIFAAVTGGHIDSESASLDRDMMGIVLQASYNFNDTIEPFVRLEYLDSDGAGDDTAVFLTVGGNYYFKKHDAKFTLDFLFFIDGDAPTVNTFGASTTGTGFGFSGDGVDQDTVIMRAQFQLLF
jgi:hypothetical protein